MGLILTDNASNAIKAFSIKPQLDKGEYEDEEYESGSDDEESIVESSDEDDAEAVLESDIEENDIITDDVFEAKVSTVITELSGEKGISCVYHSLQLVKDGLNSDKEALKLVQRFKKIVSFPSKSNHYSSMLKQLSGGLTMIKPEETR